MQYRNEIKHIISASDKIALCHSLQAIAKLDEHAREDGRYKVRSLYFDTLGDKALREKVDGLNRREKFRLRFYNGDTSLIHLEKKSKVNGMCNKQSTLVTQEEVERILSGDTGWMATSGRGLLIELYGKMKSQGLRPKTIVDYTRIPFTYSPGNVRVTIDENIRTGLQCIDFLNPQCVTIPAGESMILLEVKWDEFLPSVIRCAVQLRSRKNCAFSKYQICRIYG